MCTSRAASIVTTGLTEEGARLPWSSSPHPMVGTSSFEAVCGALRILVWFQNSAPSSLAISWTLVEKRKSPAFTGALHGLPDTHKDKLNEDLLAFLES